ncbi:hypothetical protein CBR_g55068 [Chara braunii]|uniref:Uncharacterized protein n=1 Tax=Chara braunii TaxID=69332 RepID=A0A388MCV5_CHABU|nr:hypothetical protein CBR_g55068 [Chara braunii]|eukprot:GBG92299.1 hypothetical protein CBR_g55068 [Chara braunii]
MGRAKRRQHEPAADHVQDTFRVRSPVYRYQVVGQKVDNKGVMMLHRTFCNKVFQGTQFQATRHFTQTKYKKDVSDEALYEIARRTQQKFEANQMERVARYAAERGLDVPDTGGARGGEAGRRPVEGGVEGDGGHDAPDPPLGGGGGETEEGVIHVDREARGPGEEGVPEHEDVPDSPHAVLPNHCEIVIMREVETHRAELAEELEEVRQPFWVTGVTLLSDGRKSRDGRPIVNFLAAGSRGVIVYTTINREGEPDDAEHVLRRRACIFRPYPREDDSDEEPVPKAADDPALRIPREIDETHEDADSEKMRAHTARQAASQAKREMLGGDEEFWGPFEEVASTGGPEAQATTPTSTRWESSMPPPPTPSPAPPSSVSPLQPATATADREELGSSLPQCGLLHRGGAVRQLRLRSPSPGILQEEGAPSTAAVQMGMAPAAVADVMVAVVVDEIAAAAAVLEEMAAAVLEEEAPTEGGAAAVEGQVAAAGGAAGGAAAVELEGAATVEEEEAPSAAAMEGGGARPVEEEIAAHAEVTTAAREVPASACEPQRGRGRGVSSESLEHALRAVTHVVQERTPRKRGVPHRPRLVPAEGGAALGESSGAEGLGMPHGSRREQTVAEASARVVVLRKGGGPVTIEKDDPDTDAAVREAEEDYKGEEEGEEKSRSGSDGDDDNDYDEPPSPSRPPPTRASTRSDARTS